MAQKSRLVTASFHGTVAAHSRITLVSNKIDLPFSTKRIRAAFAPGTDRLLRLSFWISPDPSAPTTDYPTGANILTQLGPQHYIVGDDNTVDFQHEIGVEVAGKYLKVHAENLDTEVHTIDVQITVEIFPWEKVEKNKLCLENTNQED